MDKDKPENRRQPRKSDQDPLRQVAEDRIRLRRSRQLRERDRKMLEWLSDHIIAVAVVLFVVVLLLVLWIYFG